MKMRCSLRCCQPRSQSSSSSAILNVTSPVKLVGRIRARFQVSSAHSESANWPQKEPWCLLWENVVLPTESRKSSYHLNDLTTNVSSGSCSLGRICSGERLTPDFQSFHDVTNLLKQFS